MDLAHRTFEEQPDLRRASLGGSPVVLQLRVENVDAALTLAVGHGAALLAGPVDFCGERMAAAYRTACYDRGGWRPTS